MKDMTPEEWIAETNSKGISVCYYAREFLAAYDSMQTAWEECDKGWWMSYCLYATLFVGADTSYWEKLCDLISILEQKTYDAVGLMSDSIRKSIPNPIRSNCNAGATS